MFACTAILLPLALFHRCVPRSDANAASPSRSTPSSSDASVRLPTPSPGEDQQRRCRRRLPLAAADWIFSRSSSSVVPGSSSPPPPPPPPPPPTFPLSQPTSGQPCLERFFASSSNPKTSNPVVSAKPPPVPSSSSLPAKRRHPSSATPLSDRMRPDTLDAVLGQDHLLSSTSILRSSRIPSIVLWGPPGSGKTTIARALSSALPASLYVFVTLSAVSSGVRELREAIDGARRARSHGRRIVLFVDEIHWFSKSQQDSFLPAIEDDSIILIG